MNNLNRHVIRLVQDIIKKYCSTEKANFEEICTGLRLDVREVPLSQGIDGMYKDSRILLNVRIRSEERRRFTQFHELMHYLFDVDDELISELHELPFRNNDELDGQEEIFANIGAAEFLMPSEKFRELYIKRGLSVELIPFAAQKFESSVIAATIQLAQVAPNKCITAICEAPYNDSSEQPKFIAGNRKEKRQKLLVTYAAASSTMKYKLARDTIIPIGHLIYDSFLKDSSVTGESYIPFRSGKNMPCTCEALADEDRVIVIFHLNSPPTPQSEKQMNLFSQS